MRAAPSEDRAGCTPAGERLRRKYQKMAQINSDTPKTTPTTAPAIFPECDLFRFKLGLEEGL